MSLNVLDPNSRFEKSLGLLTIRLVGKSITAITFNAHLMIETKFGKINFFFLQIAFINQLKSLLAAPNGNVEIEDNCQHSGL